jgi:hypothetical protein
LSEPLLAFARASCNGKPGKDGDPEGWLNSALEWSSPANDFDARSKDDDLVDAPSVCAFSVRLVSGTAAEYKAGDATALATVDVTPRRLAKFRPAPGTRCSWKAAGPAGSAGGEAVADARGLVAIPQVPVGKGGLGTRVTVAVVK